MNYFGTDLTHVGHYFWLLDGSHINSSKVYFNNIPFNPEALTSVDTPNGVVKYSRVGEYAICAIAGSCKDSRRGSKSVFWVKADIEPEALKDMILATPIAKKLIEQMPFEVNW